MKMEFQNLIRPVATATLLTALSATAQTNNKPNQLKLMLGINHAYHDNSDLYLGAHILEVDSLHENDAANDFIGGVGYSYDILPWFVNDAKLAHVWVGLDLLFFNTTQTGDVYVDQNPAFNDYNYEFSEDTMRLMVNTEVDFKTPSEKIFPFLQASVGAARIVAGYEDEPVPEIQGGGIYLDDHTNYNLVYSLGAGVKFLPNPDIQVSLSYLFTDFGFVKTSTETENFILAEPLEDHLMTSSLFFNLSYLF